MPDSCTCGAQLPPDARFCHKCGKPQRDDEPVLADEVIAAVVHSPIVEAVPDHSPVAINLANRPAVRAAFLAGLAAFLLSGPLGALGLFALGGGGVFAVYLYRRSTGQAVSAANGARLGWITGVFLFVLLLLSFTASIALEPAYFDELQKQMSERAALSEADLKTVMSVMRSPLGIGAMVFGMFIVSTLPPAVGGLVGAKLLGRN